MEGPDAHCDMGSAPGEYKFPVVMVIDGRALITWEDGSEHECTCQQRNADYAYLVDDSCAAHEYVWKDGLTVKRGASKLPSATE
jgi:hypothetical protein